MAGSRSSDVSFVPGRAGRFLGGLSLAFALATAAPALTQTLDLSPDSKLVAYCWPAGSGRAELSVTSIGSAPVPNGAPRAASIAGSCEPRWSPDGRYLVYQTANGSQSSALYDSTAGAAKDLGIGIASPYAWREDSQWFAGIRAMVGGGVEAVWYGVPQAGVPLHVPLPFTVAKAMVWLPATDDIAILGGDGNGQDIYTVEAGEVHKVTTSHDVIGMALNADRKKLVWARSSPNTRYILFSLYAYDLKERSVARLPFPYRVPALNPDPRHAPQSVDEVQFSPDGSRLAVISTFQGAGARFGPRTLHVMGIDGSSAREVVRLPGVGGDSDTRTVFARWSRDGKLLGVMEGPAGAAEIEVYDANASNPRFVLPQ